MPLGADLLSKFRKDKTKEGVAQRPVADVRDKYNFSGFATLILYTIFLHVRLKIIVVSICNIFFFLFQMKFTKSCLKISWERKLHYMILFQGNGRYRTILSFLPFFSFFSPFLSLVLFEKGKKRENSLIFYIPSANLK